MSVIITPNPLDISIHIGDVVTLVTDSKSKLITLYDVGTAALQIDPNIEDHEAAHVPEGDHCLVLDIVRINDQKGQNTDYDIQLLTPCGVVGWDTWTPRSRSDTGFSLNDFCRIVK